MGGIDSCRRNERGAIACFIGLMVAVSMLMHRRIVARSGRMEDTE